MLSCPKMPLAIAFLPLRSVLSTNLLRCDRLPAGGPWNPDIPASGLARPGTATKVRRYADLYDPPAARRAPHIYVAAMPADEWMEYLASHGVRVSPERDGVRISLGMFSTSADVERFIQVVMSRGFDSQFAVMV